MQTPEPPVEAGVVAATAASRTRGLGFVLRSAASAVRDGWLVLGATLLGFLVLEGAFRLQRAIRQLGASASVERTVPHPYAGQAWWQLFVEAEAGGVFRYRYDPYRGKWALPARSAVANVDSAGRRVTIQAAGSHARSLWMFGGSAMWGPTARDSLTIPSLTAQVLAERGVTDLEVLNFAQPGFNTMQELNTLNVELAHGRKPNLAVFFNGYNDITSTWANGGELGTYDDQAVAEMIELGRRGFWEEVFGLGRRSALVTRLREAVGLSRPGLWTQVAEGSHCGRVATYYRNIATITQGIGASHGFGVVYFLQPVHAVSGKRLTTWEAGLTRRSTIGLVPCLRSIDTAMADRAGLYHSLTAIFDDDTATVFIDPHSHITEAANRKVAERMVDVLLPLLQPTTPALRSR